MDPDSRNVTFCLSPLRPQSAAQAGCEDGLEVDVVAMGDDTDADFPAIYADLFSEKTFDPSSGGWSYQVQTSYGLPEFGG